MKSVDGPSSEHSNREEEPSNSEDLKNVIIVAGHAVYRGKSYGNPMQDENWCLQGFQRGEPPAYIEHIRAGVEMAARQPESLLVFSGGQTRQDAGPRSEGESYREVAEHFEWWGTDVAARTVTEEFARDSFENLLFGICRFYERAGRYPWSVTVISWAFKEERFELHRNAISFPASRFSFVGVGNPVDLALALEGELRNGLEPFRRDPYGTSESLPGSGAGQVALGDKRKQRNPFNRQNPYSLSCGELSELLQHCGPDLYLGSLPWTSV
jgi:hypothetical protein